MQINKYFLHICVFFCTFAGQIGEMAVNNGERLNSKNVNIYNYGKESKLDE